MKNAAENLLRWQFWIDRGGTFTDIIGRDPNGGITTHKLLSENPGHYADAALHGIREVLGIGPEDELPVAAISSVKMGTTVATNALLERKGEPTLFVTTEGFADVLRIGYQSRPRLFDLHIVLPEMLYHRVVEARERISANGDVLTPLDQESIEIKLRQSFEDGFRSVAIALIHGYRYSEHERAIGEIANEVGFTQVSLSHEVSPLMKLVPRGDTTVVDAYLTPILRRYVDTVAADVLRDPDAGTRLMFMQSNGGLTDAQFFQGKDAILSGPAGGVVGGVKTSLMADFERIIGFDMGGTSTDVSHYDGTFERAFETEVAGVRMRAPMMYIHTVAAGGGSILHFDGARYRVGPDSAGADPGPACYRNGGPLTVTDCNVMVGKLDPDLFPKVFGPKADSAVDAQIVKTKFQALSDEIHAATGDRRTLEEVADGYLSIAIYNMANAIKKISVQRGYDVSRYTLCCFGGAGGQHACRVADSLAMTTIFIHPHAGVLSAYGMGLADVTAMRERAIEKILDVTVLPELELIFRELEDSARNELLRQLEPSTHIQFHRRLLARYCGTDSPLQIASGTPEEITSRFEHAHRQRYGFVSPNKQLILEAAIIEAVGGGTEITDPAISVDQSMRIDDDIPRLKSSTIFSNGRHHIVPVVDRAEMHPGDRLTGPAIIIEPHGTNIIEPGWQASLSARNHLILTRVKPREARVAVGTDVDPVMLEIFNNLFMSIAEQMGVVLQNTSHSVNIKERLDFSCAVFDPSGSLVANAPHIPVHLGAMGESISAIIRERRDSMKLGDVYALNTPYNGGTHLPDITVITPVFDEAGKELLLFVGSRAHHSEIGGISPGSVPPRSTSIDEEGVLIDNFCLVDGGKFREPEVRNLFSAGPWPTRNIEQNLADLRAQIAANEKGVQELRRIIDEFDLHVVQAYMGHVQDNAEEMVRRVLDVLGDGHFTYPFDDGSQISVTISINRETRTAHIDFTGTSAQLPTNFNAPTSVVKAAVLYVFRTLIDDEIPLNEGCLKPLEIFVPKGSMLAPHHPAAVVAGNVETGQMVVDTLYGALKTMAAAQGTMNNFTFGGEQWQYYETICGGSGAGPDFDGTSCVHTNMTNTRLTDPEILEWRYPVILERFEIRRGSGGAGQHRGGDGSLRRIRFLEPMTAAIVSGHRKVPPFGMAGGASGACGRTWIERYDGTTIELDSCDEIEVMPGDVFVIQTPSGGGYGDPEAKAGATK
jgi:5-oxoprolinase (ATP-hydrolysing)